MVYKTRSTAASGYMLFIKGVVKQSKPKIQILTVLLKAILSFVIASLSESYGFLF